MERIKSIMQIKAWGGYQFMFAFLVCNIIGIEMNPAVHFRLGRVACYPQTLS